MNTVLSFLTQNWQRLGLAMQSEAKGLTCVTATPRFRASSHVIFFILGQGQKNPFLVVKTPRLYGDHLRLDREATNLKAVHAAHVGGFDSIPRLLAYEDYCGHRLLVETAVAGEMMSYKLRHSSSLPYVQMATQWLIELHQATSQPPSQQVQGAGNLLENALQRFTETTMLTQAEVNLVARTREIVGVVQTYKLPTVFEHGDLGPLNVMFSADEKIGVVDWELAEPNGLPTADLFFLLALASPAWRKAKQNSDYVAAFHQTFFGKCAWANVYVHQYAEQMKLPTKLLAPLFVLSWARYLMNLVERLSDTDSGQQVSTQTMEWLRANRYYTLWRHAVEQYAELSYS